jgi:hypothetical protein
MHVSASTGWILAHLECLVQILLPQEVKLDELLLELLTVLDGGQSDAQDLSRQHRHSSS